MYLLRLVRLFFKRLPFFFASPTPFVFSSSADDLPLPSPHKRAKKHVHTREMWKTVPCRDTQFFSKMHSSRHHNAAKSVINYHREDDECVAPNPHQAAASSPPPSANPLVSRLAKDIRRGSRLFASRDAGHQVLEALVDVLQRYPSCCMVRLLGLGIGPLTSETSLVQSQYFLYLTEAIKQVRYVRCVDCSVFDPLMSDVDRLVFEKIGIGCESRNVFGAYRVPNDTVLIAFMPHCPITLYRNLLAANWPAVPFSSSEKGGSGDVAEAAISEPLQRLMILGNDFAAYNISPADARTCNVTRLLPMLEISSMASEPKERSRRKRLGGSDGGPLDDMRIVSVSRSLTPARLADFCFSISTKQPAIEQAGPDILLGGEVRQR